MNKDKLTDRRENNIENKKEDYTDGNGNPEEFIEDMTDLEATAIFKEAFYAEGKALEEEALRSSFVEDEEKKEVLRLRILAAAGRSAEGTSAADGSVADDDAAAHRMMAATSGGSEREAAAEHVELEHNVVLENQSNDALAGKAVVRKSAAETASGETTAVSEAPVRSNDMVKASAEEVKKKKRRFTPFMRWAAVLALVCLGVFGVSVTGQAKGSGLWSSIQRLIGGETRWEQDDNGENRTYTNPEEEKAVSKIEEELGIIIPKFFYWPDELIFEDMYIFEESSSFMIMYSNEDQIIYFEGWKGESNTSLNNTWMSEEKENQKQVEYDGIFYTITEADDEDNGKRYYVRWMMEDNRFVLSGIENLEEVKKIIKNIKI